MEPTNAAAEASAPRPLELHCFVLKTRRDRPFALVIPAVTPAPVRECSAPPRLAPQLVTRTCPAARDALARDLGLPRSALKFAPEAAARRIAEGSERPAMLLLGSQIELDRRYAAAPPCVPAAGAPRALSGRGLAARGVFIGADAIENLRALATALALAAPMPRACAAGYSAKCPACGARRPIPGRRPARAWRCSRCCGDSQKLLVIARLAVARACGDDSATRALRAMLARAVKVGHAEAVHAVVGALGAVSAADLDLAIRCRRAGVVAEVLAVCAPAEVDLALARAEKDPENAWGESAGDAFDFGDLRARLREAAAVLARAPAAMPGACREGWLVARRGALPAPLRARVVSFMPRSHGEVACERLHELLEWTEHIKIPGGACAG